jgi:hypothetical protein
LPPGSRAWRLLRARGRSEEAFAAADRGLAYRDRLGLASIYVKRCLAEWLECAVELGDLARAEGLLAELDELQPGERTPTLEAQRLRFRARVAARRGGEAGIDADFGTATRLFAEHELPFQRAVVQLEHAEWLAERGRGDEAGALVAAARETFERLEARPWLERLAELEPGERAGVPA